MERLRQDLAYAVRILFKDRAFSLTTLVTLAVCIGANAAIFAVVNSVLLRPLPTPQADRLVLLYNSYPNAGVVRASTGVPDYYDRLRETDVFDELALFNERGVTVGSDAGSERVQGMVGRPSLFRMLRAAPMRGRIFTEAEGEPGQDRKVILSYGLWQRMFGGSESALGRTLRLGGEPYEIVGIMPSEFHFMSAEVELWMPLSFTADEKSDDARHSNNWTMVGRLKPGASVQQAQQQIDALNARNLERFPNMKQVIMNAGFHTVVTPLQEDMIAGVRRTLLLLWGGVFVVLVIGAVNITNLTLIRSSTRFREIATRHALGAGIGRLTRQLLTETVLLTIAGGAAGALLGYAGLSLLTGGGLDTLPRASEIRMDAVAVVFTLALALIVGIVVGLAPVIGIRRMNLSQAFREEGRSGTSGRGTRVIRRILVTSQVAFAFMLLVGAGLLLASFQHVLAVPAGFETSNLLTSRISLPASRYEPANASAFVPRLLSELRTIPGVRNAGITTDLPFGGDFSDSVILAEGYQMAPGESLISPYSVRVSPGYLEALNVPLVHGRFFADSDTADSQRVVIVDERLARKFWPGQNPVGRRMFKPQNAEELSKPGPNQQWIHVVGVVGETKMADLVTTEKDRIGTYYFPMTQDPARALTLAVRTAGDPLAIVPQVRRALDGIDPELPLYAVRTMEDRIDETLTDRRTPMVLAVVFGSVALFLAAIGLYGVLAYQVTQRRKELGIRMALGSEPRGIFGLVLREGVTVLAAGFVVGGAGAFAIRRTMATQLYGIGPMDPTVFALVGAILAVVAVVACSVPARRAARIDPLIALNEQ
jgi:predicted permease